MRMTRETWSKAKVLIQNRRDIKSEFIDEVAPEGAQKESERPNDTFLFCFPLSFKINVKAYLIGLFDHQQRRHIKRLIWFFWLDFVQAIALPTLNRRGRESAIDEKGEAKNNNKRAKYSKVLKCYRLVRLVKKRGQSFAKDLLWLAGVPSYSSGSCRSASRWMSSKGAQMLDGLLFVLLFVIIDRRDVVGGQLHDGQLAGKATVRAEPSGRFQSRCSCRWIASVA